MFIKKCQEVAPYFCNMIPKDLCSYGVNVVILLLYQQRKDSDAKQG